MDLELAEEIVKELLAPQYLSPIQQQVFRSAWAGEGYGDFADRTGYEINYIRGVGAQIWRLLSAATDRKVTKTNVCQLLAELAPLPVNAVPATPAADWPRDINGMACYGRERELELLRQWISIERCRQVAIVGMGGIGKTALAQALVRTWQVDCADDRFSYICWRSLLAPLPLAELLPGLIRTLIYGLADNAITEAAIERNSGNPIAQIELSIEILKKHRCLLVFDRCEMLFQAGMQAGTYRPEFANYSELFNRVGQVRHQSCLVLIGRELPNEIGQLSGIDAKTRTLVLTGVNKRGADRLFSERDCTPPALDEWAQIAAYCDGNPAILQTLATTVRAVAGGNTSEIIPSLRSSSLGFADIQILLEQQWERASQPELQALYWLAIARSPLTLDELSAYLHPDWNRTSARNCPLPSVLQSLNRRNLVFTQARSANLQRQWSLLPMTIEYALDRLVARLGEEIEAARPKLLDTHAIAPATAPEYIRQQQLQSIVRPLLERLRATIGSASEIAARLRQILTAGRELERCRSGYLAGNILTLLIELAVDLADLDCDGLVVRQADLATIDLAAIGLTAERAIDCAVDRDFQQILTVAYSPNGRIFAVGDRCGGIWLWHEGGGDRGEMACTGHTDAVRAIGFSPDGRYLASISDDRTIGIWQTNDGRLDLTIAMGRRGSSLSFSPDGRYLAVGSDRMIYYWDLTTQMCIHQLVGAGERVLSLCHHPYGGKLASGSADGTLQIWDLAAGTAKSAWNAHSRAITAVAYSPDGRTLLSGSLDGKLRLWEDAQCRLEIAAAGGEIYAAAFGPDGLQVAIAGADGTLGQWCARTGQCLCRWTTLAHRPARTIAVRPDGSAIATAGDDSTICFWQASDGLCARILHGRDRGFRSIAWSKDNQTVICGGRDGRIGMQALDGSCRSFTAHPQRLSALAIDPHAGSLATSGDDRTIKIWDGTGACAHTLRGIAPQSALVYGAKGAYLVGTDARALRIWDTQSWQCVRTFAGYPDRIIALAAHPDRDLVASAGEDGTVRLWQVNRDEPLRSIECSHPVSALAFAPHAPILAIGSEDDRIYLWHTETGELCHTLTGHGGRILALAYSTDGNWLCSGASDRTIKIWSPASGLCRATLVGHQDWVDALAISSCARTLASASADGTVKFWDLAAGDREREGIEI